MNQGAFSRARLFAAVALPAALFFSYRDVIEGLVHQWSHSEDYSHGFLILPIALYLVWMKRADLRAVPIGSDWRGLFLVLAVLLQYTWYASLVKKEGEPRGDAKVAAVLNFKPSLA